MDTTRKTFYLNYEALSIKNVLENGIIFRYTNGSLICKEYIPDGI